MCGFLFFLSSFLCFIFVVRFLYLLINFESLINHFGIQKMETSQKCYLLDVQLKNSLSMTFTFLWWHVSHDEEKKNTIERKSRFLLSEVHPLTPWDDISCLFKNAADIVIALLPERWNSGRTVLMFHYINIISSQTATYYKATQKSIYIHLTLQHLCC